MNRTHFESIKAAQNRRGGTGILLRGSVVHAPFLLEMPDIHNEPQTGDDGDIVIEVIKHPDERTIRSIALTPTDGLARGNAIENCFARRWSWVWAGSGC